MNYVVPPMPPDHADDPAGDRALRVRDARLQELLSRYGDLLRRTIAKVCPQTMGLSVEEIEQDARVRLWSALKSERDIVHPVSYVYKVAVSAALRAIRRAKARREDQLQDDDIGFAGYTTYAGHAGRDGAPAEALRTRPDASPEALAERREWVRKIDVAMRHLAENRRRAARLHLRGMTTQEIADILGWSEPKARNLVHRGLKDLRTRLRLEGVEYGARRGSDAPARRRPPGRGGGFACGGAIVRASCS